MTELVNYGFGIMPIIPPRKKKERVYGEENGDENEKSKVETCIAIIVLSALILMIAWILVFAVTRIGGG